MQEVFAIPIIDEIRNSSDNREDSTEEIVDDNQNDENIDDEIQNMEAEDLDELFDVPKAS